MTGGIGNISAQGIEGGSKVLHEGEVILEDIDFYWPRDKIQTAIQLWQENTPIEDMVEKLRPARSCGARVSYDRRADEVALLLMHLARQGKISLREGGIMAL